jgi:hypothetical protein
MDVVGEEEGEVAMAAITDHSRPLPRPPETRTWGGGGQLLWWVQKL